MESEKVSRGADLKDRTKAFALRVIRLYAALPNQGAARVIGGSCKIPAFDERANFGSLLAGNFFALRLLLDGGYRRAIRNY